MEHDYSFYDHFIVYFSVFLLFDTSNHTHILCSGKEHLIFCSKTYVFLLLIIVSQILKRCIHFQILIMVTMFFAQLSPLSVTWTVRSERLDFQKYGVITQRRDCFFTQIKKVAFKVEI